MAAGSEVRYPSRVGSPRLWFRNAFEGLFVRGLADVRTPALERELEAVGVRLTRLENQYPVETLLRALEVAGPVVAPGVTPFEQQRELGRRFTRGYFATPLGGALSQALRLVGPQFGMARVGRTYRTVTNYLDARPLVLERGRAVLSFEPAAELAAFLLGNGEASFALLHRGSSETKLESIEGDRVVTSVTWS